MIRLDRKPLMRLVVWSIPEMAPAALIGVAVAHAVDSGFLAGRPEVGLVWLIVIVVASLAGAVGSRQVIRHLGDLVEPVRDDLVKRVVSGALQHGIAGRADDGAVARLTRQVEIVRDTYAGLIVVSRAFLVALIGTVAGLLTLDPVLLVFILPPVAVGMAAFLTTLRLAAARYRESVSADEQLAAASSSVLTGARDVFACGTEMRVLAMLTTPVRRQARAELSMAWTAMLRTACFAVAGWSPLILVLAAAPWLFARGLSAGEIMGSLTYVLFGLQPAIGRLMTGIGGSGLRFTVALKRVLEATRPCPPEPLPNGSDGQLRLRAVTFAYGRHSEPVLRNLDLTIEPGDHLAILGPSGIGKSTLAAILCGLLRPDSGSVHLGGRSVLIPQEAYVFTGTMRENLCYLRPAATDEEIEAAVTAIGAQRLLSAQVPLSSQVPTALSAGERQLIALVRAYLSPAPIAVLDEATCHLDPQAERQAEEAFARQGRTLIVIAHRVSSALRAQRVLVLDGAHAMIGDHATLAARSALYRELLGHWANSDPAGLPGDPDGLDPVAASRLRQHPGKVIAHRAVAEKQLGGDVPGR